MGREECMLSETEKQKWINKSILLFLKIHYVNVIAIKSKKKKTKTPKTTCMYLGRTHNYQGLNLEKCVLTEKPPIHIMEPRGGAWTK